jgi:glutathione synthase/RimK-type ligase-like ATP-grasp enzyme
MNNIYILTDYKDRFGSKYSAKPYRSGMDKDFLIKFFYEAGYKVKFMKFSEIDFRSMDFQDIPVLYTSQEDWGYHYKSYIEDIVLGLELQGAQVIPPYKYLRANNNKVFMEILRDQLEDEGIKTIKSFHFGCLEELEANIDSIEFPVVIKSAAGAMSTGVFLAKKKIELIKYAKRISRTKYIYQEFKEIARCFKHKGYIKESIFRSKFIVQNYIPGLENDWKVLVYGERYYIFKRPNRKNDFRASGSGNQKYLYGDNSEFPESIFDYAKGIFDLLKIPHLSLDIGFSNNAFYLIEFQAVYFGSVGQGKSDICYVIHSDNWQKEENRYSLEQVYVDSILQYLKVKL